MHFLVKIILLVLICAESKAAHVQSQNDEVMVTEAPASQKTAKIEVPNQRNAKQYVQYDNVQPAQPAQPAQPVQQPQQNLIPGLGQLPIIGTLIGNLPGAGGLLPGQLGTLVGGVPGLLGGLPILGGLTQGLGGLGGLGGAGGLPIVGGLTQGLGGLGGAGGLPIVGGLTQGLGGLGGAGGLPIVGGLTQGLGGLGGGNQGGLGGLGGLLNLGGGTGANQGGLGSLLNLGGLGGAGASLGQTCPVTQKLNCKCEPLLAPTRSLGRKLGSLEILEHTEHSNDDGTDEMSAVLSNGLTIYQRTGLDKDANNQDILVKQGFYSLKLREQRYLTIYFTISDLDYTVKADVSTEPPRIDVVGKQKGSLV